MSSDSPVTLDAIASEAGVSKWTVARVLNGENKETWPSAKARAKHIRAIAERLGYRPNTAAKAVRTGRFGAIGLVLGAQSMMWLPLGLLRQLQRHAAEAHWNLLVSTFTSEQLTSEEQLPKLLRELAVDGLVLDLLDEDLEAIETILRRHRIPAICLNVDRPEDCVRFDDRGSYAAAVTRLAQSGRRRIGYCGRLHAVDHYSHRDRQRGYLDGIANMGGQADMLDTSEAEPAAQFAAVRRWLERDDRPDAVLTYSAGEAHLVYAAGLSLGLRFPEDISIVASHDAPLVLPGYRIETLVLAQRRVAHEAVAMLQSKIADPTTPISAIALPLVPHVPQPRRQPSSK